MNKEEIEKEDKEHLIEVLTEHKDYIFEFDDDNIKVEYILDYIRELEFQNTALKAEHDHNITRIKELEQKESILDKITELANKIATENAEKYNSENQKEVDFSEWNIALEILNIIEGEKE